MSGKGLMARIYRNSQNSTVKKKKIIKSENGQRTRTEISFSGIYRWQICHEKMVSIINHEAKAKQNHDELSLHTCQMGTVL